MTGIVRLPLDLTAVVEVVQDLAVDRAAGFVIDAENLGAALWQTVVGRPWRRGWLLYAKRGVDRHEITTDLAVAIHEGTFRVAADLAEQPALAEALVAWRREDRQDGPDSELVVAFRHALAGWPSRVARIW